MRIITIEKCRENHRGFKILDEKESLLGEKGSLMEAIAFARGLLDEKLVDNPFEYPNCHEFNNIILRIPLTLAIAIMEGLRHLQPMTISDRLAVINSYKQGHAARPAPAQTA